MTPALLHQKLIQACKTSNIDEVKYYLNAGADPNFNIKTPSNALFSAIEIDNYEAISLLLENGAILKEFVLQKAIERDKNYLLRLIPNFDVCQDKALLNGVLQAAINISDFKLAKQAVIQGAEVEKLFLYAVRDINSIEILKLLLDKGFDIHGDKNNILTEWMASSERGEWGRERPIKYHLLAFISEYYLEKKESLKKFESLRLPDIRRLFRLGLNINNVNMMKFALKIGADKNEALNSALNRYYANKQENNEDGETAYKIVEYILSSTIKFKKATISNAVCLQYFEVLDALKESIDLEYGYEMSYKYENDNLCDYFIQRGVSLKVQILSKMKVSAIRGDLKELEKVVNEGADLSLLELDTFVEVINANQLKTIKYIYDSGVTLDISLNRYLNDAITYHKAYETISYLVELGFDITEVKKIPQEYKKRYPHIADMWERKINNIFDYTIYLASEAYHEVDSEKEKGEILERVAELSTLPYVVQRSQGKTR